MTITIPFELDRAHRRVLIGGEPMLFHCHHYNTFLQRSIQDASYIESRPYLIGAAAEVAYAQLVRLFQSEGADDVNRRNELASELYRWAGFGTVDLSAIGESGGRVESKSSHYARAWSEKFGSSDEPVCLFPSGWIAGAAAAIHGKPLGSYSVQHTSCAAQPGKDTCLFEVQAGEANYDVFESVGAGEVGEHEQRPRPENNIDEEGIYEALTAMEIAGDKDGIIPAFGVYLTRHYANYYNRISFETLRAMEAAFGPDGYDATRPLFVEAGHVCAFNTFGGIMTSPEWNALIRPTCKTDADWVHGMVACVNTLGWGRWNVEELSPTEAVFSIQDDYESVGYRAMYGTPERPISFLAEGAAAGIMNLVYRGEVMSSPEFTPEYYDHLFRQTDVFRAEPAGQSVAMGDKATTIRVTRG